jgi:hypothetical protein
VRVTPDDEHAASHRGEEHTLTKPSKEARSIAALLVV